MSLLSPWLALRRYPDREGYVPFQILDRFGFELPFVEVSRKTFRSRGLKVATADVANPMPVSHVDQIATSIVE